MKKVELKVKVVLYVGDIFCLMLDHMKYGLHEHTRV